MRELTNIHTIILLRISFYFSNLVLYLNGFTMCDTFCLVNEIFNHLWTTNSTYVFYLLWLYQLLLLLIYHIICIRATIYSKIYSNKDQRNYNKTKQYDQVSHANRWLMWLLLGNRNWTLLNFLLHIFFGIFKLRMFGFFICVCGFTNVCGFG